MPTEVLMMIGQIAVMKMTKNADGSVFLKAASESGSQASGGTVRSTWKIGSSPLRASELWPIRTPSATPGKAARLKAKAAHFRGTGGSHNKPFATPRRARKGCRRDNRVSLRPLG